MQFQFQPPQVFGTKLTLDMPFPGGGDGFILPAPFFPHETNGSQSGSGSLCQLKSTKLDIETNHDVGFGPQLFAGYYKAGRGERDWLFHRRRNRHFLLHLIREETQTWVLFGFRQKKKGASQFLM